MKHLRRIGGYLPTLFTLLVLTVTFRTVALFTDFNLSDGYFGNKLIRSLSDLTVFIACIATLTFTFMAKKIRAIAVFDNPATYIPSGMISVSLIFLAVETLVSLSTRTGGILSKATLTTPSSLLSLLSAILAAVCVINFFLTVFYTSKENESRAFFGILTVVFLAIYALYLYFDTKLPLNSPNKSIDQMALLLSACFFLFETRISLGRERWRGYVAFGMIASLITAYSSIPTLIYYFVTGKMISDSLSGAMLCFTLFIYVTARVLLIGALTENEKSEAAVTIEILAGIRKEELSIPSQERINNNEESFATLGKNYEIDLHLVNKVKEETASEDETVAESDERN